MAHIFGVSTESLTSRFENLSDRERKMSYVFAGVLILLIVGGGLYWIVSNGNNRRQTLETMELQLKEISNNKDNYVEAKRRLERFDGNRISNLRTYLDGKAKSLGLPTDSLVEGKDAQLQKATPDNLKLEIATFTIKQVSIDMLTAFLEAVEGREKDGAIKISGLNVRVNAVASDLLDATMTIASWKRKT